MVFVGIVFGIGLRSRVEAHWRCAVLLWLFKRVIAPSSDYASSLLTLLYLFHPFSALYSKSTFRTEFDCDDSGFKVSRLLTVLSIFKSLYVEFLDDSSSEVLRTI